MQRTIFDGSACMAAQRDPMKSPGLPSAPAHLRPHISPDMCSVSHSESGIPHSLRLGSAARRPDSGQSAIVRGPLNEFLKGGQSCPE